MRDLIDFVKDATTKVTATVGVGATLLAGTTYYVELCDLEGDGRSQSSVVWKWDDDIIVTITVEATNFPELAIYAADTAGWKAQAGIATVTVLAGTQAGVDAGSWKHQGYGRLRAKLAVGATGGVIRGAINHKAG